MGIPFHESVYGHRFFDVQLPKLIQAVNRLAEATEKQNALLVEVAQQKKSGEESVTLVCRIKKREGKTWQRVGDISVFDTPRKAALWANESIQALKGMGFMPVPESEADFFDNIASNPGGLLFLYQDGDSASNNCYSVSIKDI